MTRRPGDTNTPYTHGHVSAPHKALATAIIMTAIHDRKDGKKKGEVLAFFQSSWFDLLCELALVNPDVAREKLKIKMPARRRA